jgi:CBS domain-containing protein
MKTRSAKTRPLAHLSGSTRRPAAQTRLGEARLLRAAEAHVALTDSAEQVVTDFIWEEPVTVPEERSIDDALRDMIRAGVRALLVMRGDAVTGLITSYDIQGERPLQFLAAAGYSRHDEIEVGHIMTPWERVPTLDWQRVSRARVSEIESFFSDSQATHAVLVEHSDQVGTFVRGVVSRARLERQLERQISRGVDRREADKRM